MESWATSSVLPSRRRRRPSQGPRERLEELGAGALSDSEILALLLRTGARESDGVTAAEGLLEQLGGLQGLVRAGGGQLRGPGIGRARSASLEAALELSRRLATRRLRRGDPLSGPDEVFRHFHARLRDLAHECFAVLLLDGRHRLVKEALISQGTLTASLVHPREVFRPALREAAAALVLVHNHPSGDPTPSREDRDVTARLARAGELLGIPVLDHV
ncbi:MAG: DNA repair protein RadC, partial [Myxococcota bacterium]